MSARIASLFLAACLIPPSPQPARGDPLPPGAVARLGTTRLRHEETVNSVRFSPDGKILASASFDGTVRLWHAATGAPRGRPLRCPGPARVAVFSPDGGMLAASVGGYDWQPQAIMLWDVRTGEERWRASPKVQVRALAFAPDGKTLASGGFDHAVRLWDAGSGREVRCLKGHRDTVLSLAFSPDGKVAASCGNDAVYLWDVTTGRMLAQVGGNYEGAECLALSPDGKLLAIGGARRTELREVATGRLVRQVEDSPFSAAFSPDGKILATGVWTRKGWRARLWDVASGRELHRLDGHEDAVRCVAFSPDGRALATTSCNSVRLWDVASRKERFPSPGHHDAVSFVSFAADGEALATADGRSVCLWDARSGKQLHRLAAEYDPVTAVSFTPSGKRLAAWDGSRLLSWDAASGRRPRVLGVFDRKTKMSLRENVVFSRDATVLATWNRDSHYSPSGINLCDASTGKLIRALNTAQLDYAGEVAFSPGGRLLASSDDNNWRESDTIRLWQVSTGKQTGQMNLPQVNLPRVGGEKERVSRLAFSPDGRLLAAGTNTGSVWLWDTGDRRPLLPLEGQRGAVHAVAFSPDGRTLASAGRDGVVRLSEIATGKERLRLEGRGGQIVSVAFSPDGKSLVSGSKDTTALVWDVSVLLPGEEAAGEDAERLWADLASGPKRAYRAIRLLRRLPDGGVRLIREWLRPASLPDRVGLVRLIADLESRRFPVRQAAALELGRLGELAEPALRLALTGQPSLEARRRISQLLEGLEQGRWRPVGEELRRVRAVEVLERAGTPDARELVKALARGHPGARLTKEASASLGRLTRK